VRWQGLTERSQTPQSSARKLCACRSAIIDARHVAEEDWSGQGTIYPDTIESGAARQGEPDQDNHNRVAGIQRVMEGGRHVAPVKSLL